MLILYTESPFTSIINPKIFGSTNWESFNATTFNKNKRKTLNTIILLLENCIDPDTLNIMDLFLKTAKYTMKNLSFFNQKNRTISIQSLFNKKLSIKTLLLKWKEVLNDIQNLVINNFNQNIPKKSELDNLILKFIIYKKSDLDESIKVIDTFINDKNVNNVAFYKYISKAIINSLKTDTSLYHNVQLSHNIMAMKQDKNIDPHYFFQSKFMHYDPSNLNKNNFYNNNHNNKNNNVYNNYQSNFNNNYAKNRNFNKSPIKNNSKLTLAINEVNVMMNKIGGKYERKNKECVWYQLHAGCIKQNCYKQHVCPIEGDKHPLYDCPTYKAGTQNLK